MSVVNRQSTLLFKGWCMTLKWLLHRNQHLCHICNRLLFTNQVKPFHDSRYDSDVLRTCIGLTTDIAQCSGKSSFICFTCDRTLSKKSIPCQAKGNKLQPASQPEQLKYLNCLEKHLVTPVLPFMKIIPLPKGAQKGIHGPVVCVQSDVSGSAACLPRLPSDSSLIKVKLKRKLEYKGHHLYQQVNPNKVKDALECLQALNPHFQDICVNCYHTVDNDTTVMELPGSDKLAVGSSRLNFNTQETLSSSGIISSAASYCQLETSSVCDRIGIDHEQGLSTSLDRSGEVSQSSAPQFTCLQPTNIAQYVADNLEDTILCLAPAEQYKPCNMSNSEAKAFPTLFPDGKNAIYENRIVKITPKRYFNARLLSADSRFANDPEYIFYAQYHAELNEVTSSISIAMRKGCTKNSAGELITSSVLQNSQRLHEILNQDEGFKFLKKIRGTPPYWENTMRDVYAMVRQLGIPTWFCSFSAADRRWPEIVEAILEQQHKPIPETISWTDHCKIIASNPVTAARMFEHRVQALISHVILSPAQPIGEVVDYFYRVEFQQRGWPHIHCLFWVKNAPRIDQSTDTEVATFINQYVTCKMPLPTQDPELHEIVSSVQVHSKNHSKSCKKGGKRCRFNFPQLPSLETFISRPHSCSVQDETSGDTSNTTSQHAEHVLQKMWDNIFKSTSTVNLQQVFQELHITQEEFQNYVDIITSKRKVYLKRCVQDVWVNNYNEHLLRLWNANMDIQFVLDAYSCIMYILSYMTKAEHEMGSLLKQAQQEAREGNTDAVAELRRLGSVYLNHREVSIMEAVYRVTSMPLKQCSRQVLFVPTEPNNCKISLPLTELRKKENDATDIWLPSISDKYLSRPHSHPFTLMCLATFVSQYRSVSDSQVCNKKCNSTSQPIKLRNDQGYIVRRIGKCAVIRYARIKQQKDQEKYYQSILRLYLPHFEIDFKPTSFKTYEEYFLNGNFNGMPVCQVVAENMQQYETLSQHMDDVLEEMKSNPIQEQSWADIASESELSRIEDVQDIIERGENNTTFEHEFIPEMDHDMISRCKFIDNSDLTDKGTTMSGGHFEKVHVKLKQSEITPLLQSLNKQQRQLFNHVHKHCKDKTQDPLIQPFHIFLTGGAGTGKSQLIKCIKHECAKVLSAFQDNPDNITILLVAYTGTAAYNVGGQTIHSALSIYSTSMPYKPLGEDQLNTLRSKLKNLQVLIIDEVSMVDHNMLNYIHGRLQQIMRTDSKSVFGNVSVLAVGDFYQIPPVKGKPLYKNDNSLLVNLWSIFTKWELHEIMRQKDDLAFAQLLNRLRDHVKGALLTPTDDDILRSCIKEPPQSDLIHIAAKRCRVDHHNSLMLSKLATEHLLIKAVDVVKDRSGKLKVIPNVITSAKTALNCELEVAVGARVMLVVNLDVTDGLVNGLTGTIKAVIKGNMPNGQPAALCILFDDCNAGASARRKISPPKHVDQRCIVVKPHHETFNAHTKHLTRYQFPLKLAWAVAIHKVQGITVDSAVVSFDGIFQAGMAYVALSRVRSLHGLYIQDYNPHFIYSCKHVKEALSAMTLCDLTKSNMLLYTSKNFSIVHHNVQSLPSHFLDIKSNHEYNNADVLCFSESWLTSSKGELYNISGYTLYTTPQQRRGNGVATYIRSYIPHNVVDIINCPFDAIILAVNAIPSFLILSLYRSPQSSLRQFKEQLQRILLQMEQYSHANGITYVVILGDLNYDLLQNPLIEPLKSFTQLIKRSTTSGNTLLDHIYVKPVPENLLSPFSADQRWHNTPGTQLKMETIAQLKKGPSKPYQTPLHCTIATRSDVITYQKDGVQKTMMYVALCDNTDYIKATLYDPSKIAQFGNGSTVYVRNYICRTDKTLALTSQTKVYPAKPIAVPDEIIQNAVHLVRPPTPPPMLIKDVKVSPVKTMATLSGEVTQDEVPKEVFVKGEATKVRTVTLTQHNDTIKMSLWRQDADCEIKTGDYIMAKNVMVKAYQGEMQVSSTSRTNIVKTTPPDEELFLTVLSVTDNDPYNLLCQIDGDTVGDYTCQKEILLNMLPDEIAIEDDFEETLLEILPATCCVLVQGKEIISVRQKLQAVNE
ncbi:ATP-dependent DNA helicase PIF1 [Holothuria leucospilota]|uniref:ATP-dependent DNA helicase n=1 Tax=Holothuria leucospilota TaxID=206669 RepID=A0A9Q1BX30_HOLLE|nr:ATP-dependent DNA helicase PIF1 [Holothuria leucospilota]